METEDVANEIYVKISSISQKHLISGHFPSTTSILQVHFSSKALKDCSECKVASHFNGSIFLIGLKPSKCSDIHLSNNVSLKKHCLSAPEINDRIHWFPYNTQAESESSTVVEEAL